MTLTIDARGLACPHPVVLTNKAFEESDEVMTIVDNPVARENVTRLAESRGFRVEVETREDGIYLHMRREQVAQPQPTCGLPVSGPTVLLIVSNGIGRGSDDLGRKLMVSFVQILHETRPRPETVIFMNSGVQLVAEGSAVIEDLRSLEEQGVRILACGTCLGFYDLKEKVRVGQISNMFDIASALLNAGRVVSL